MCNLDSFSYLCRSYSSASCPLELTNGRKQLYPLIGCFCSFSNSCIKFSCGLYHNGPRPWFIPPSSLLHGGPIHASLFTEGKKICRLDVVNWRGMDSIFIAIVKLYLLEIIQIRSPTSHLVFDSVDKSVLTCLHLWVNRVQIHYQWIWERFNLGWHGPIEPFLPSPYLYLVNFCSMGMSCVSNS